MTLSRELTLKCFPHKEAVIYNIELSLQVLQDSTEDIDRATKLAEVHNLLREKKIVEAVSLTERIGYKLMSLAIGIHWNES